MVIEIDRKKNAQYRKYTLITIGLYLFATAVFIGGALAVVGQNWPLLSVILATYIAVMFMFVRVFGRAFKFRRTDHHLFLDQTGLAIVDGHARVDIPWGDIEKITLSKAYVANINLSKYILVKLRPNTPYNKRKYRLYDDYEHPLKEVHTQLKELWTAGQEKAKLSEG